ncbi:uncharacterized protein L201_002378 [Kwoniella dendrophila CBS 6074]|uniref:F-box domain-containing protein n=1 Tax=Kwoniella dendrophila CBS 6074 TaxID=1295534 RepID=A0AAX4JRE9_9TREE
MSSTVSAEATFTTESGKKLPSPAIHNILSFLQQRRQTNTLSRLATCSKTFYKLVIPYVYKDVYVDGPGFGELLRPLIQLKPEQAYAIFRKLPSQLPEDVWTLQQGLRIRWTLSPIQKLRIVQRNDDITLGNMTTIKEIASILNDLIDERLLPNLDKLSFYLNIIDQVYVDEILNITEVLSKSCNELSLCIEQRAGKSGWFPMPKFCQDLRIKENGLVYHSINSDIALVHSNVNPRVSFSKARSYAGSNNGHMGDNKEIINDQVLTCTGAAMGVDGNENSRWRIIRGHGYDRFTDEDCRKFKGYLMKELAEQFADNGYGSPMEKARKKCIREWPDTAEWVFGEESLIEPPCEACGRPV